MITKLTWIVSINNHSLWVYEVDGLYIKPTKVDVCYALTDFEVNSHDILLTMSLLPRHWQSIMAAAIPVWSNWTKTQVIIQLPWLIQDSIKRLQGSLVFRIRTEIPLLHQLRLSTTVGLVQAQARILSHLMKPRLKCLHQVNPRRIQMKPISLPLAVFATLGNGP